MSPVTPVARGEYWDAEDVRLARDHVEDVAVPKMSMLPRAEVLQARLPGLRQRVGLEV